ncbi:tetratricopeptide repeat protein [Belliella alkalica]|nr:tetratricopeptide repeat protein [Belliella alkalica]
MRSLIEDSSSIGKMSFQNQNKEINEVPSLEGSNVVNDDAIKKELIPKPTQEQDSSQIAGVLKKLDEDLKTNPSASATPDNSEKKQRKKRSGSDDLIETIRKKEKKEILDIKKKEQIDIIKSFSKKEIKLATLKEIENFQKQSDLSENSTKLNPNLISESYARLLAKQGKNKKAKEIYQKLIVKFPNKSTYFADLIKELENKN